jgi:hypothetical protein
VDGSGGPLKKALPRALVISAATYYGCGENQFGRPVHRGDSYLIIPHHFKYGGQESNHNMPMTVMLR